MESLLLTNCSALESVNDKSDISKIHEFLNNDPTLYNDISNISKDYRFSPFDIKSAYYNCRLYLDQAKYMRFKTEFGIYEPQTLIFGFKFSCHLCICELEKLVFYTNNIILYSNDGLVVIEQVDFGLFDLAGRTLSTSKARYLSQTKILLAAKEIIYDNHKIIFDISKKILINDVSLKSVLSKTYESTSAQTTFQRFCLILKYNHVINESSICLLSELLADITLKFLEVTDIVKVYSSDFNARIIHKLVNDLNIKKSDLKHLSSLLHRYIHTDHIKIDNDGLIKIKNKICITSTYSDTLMKLLYKYYKSAFTMMSLYKSQFLLKNYSSKINTYYHNCSICMISGENMVGFTKTSLIKFMATENFKSAVYLTMLKNHTSSYKNSTLKKLFFNDINIASEIIVCHTPDVKIVNQSELFKVKLEDKIEKPCFVEQNLGSDTYLLIDDDSHFCLFTSNCGSDISKDIKEFLPIDNSTSFSPSPSVEEKAVSLDALHELLLETSKLIFQSSSPASNKAMTFLSTEQDFNNYLL
uniref:Ribonuclease H n=1 Tax=Strongyloides stercoralis TaxID=6248 RepID=A0A0K0EBL7_STRER